MNTISNKANTVTKKKGMTAIDNAFTEIPDIPEPTNKLTPTGGVMKPIAKLTTIKLGILLNFHPSFCFNL